MTDDFLSRIDDMAILGDKSTVSRGTRNDISISKEAHESQPRIEIGYFKREYMRDPYKIQIQTPIYLDQITPWRGED